MNGENSKRWNSNKQLNSYRIGSLLVFWLKYLVSFHGQLISVYNEIMKHSINIPEWLAKEITYLLPKSQDTSHPKSYKPITCLPVIYKILTALILERIYSHLQKTIFCQKSRKDAEKKSRECKDQLLISQMVMQHAKKFKKDRYVTWIDCRKAFDSTPTHWLSKYWKPTKLTKLSKI